MYYSSIAVLALFILLIINYNVLKKENKRDLIPAHRSYRRFLIGVIFFFIEDALWGVLYEFSMAFVYADTMLFFATMAVTVFLWTRYVIAYLQEKNTFSAFLIHGGWLVLGFTLLVLVINLFLPILFLFDENGGYHACGARYVLMLSQIFLFMSTAIYMLIITAQAEKKVKFRHRTIGSFGLSMTVFIVVQTFCPLLPLYSIGCLLGTCILHTFVLEDEKEDRRLELEKLLVRERRQRRELESARQMAYTDALTGVKNKHAYVEAELDLDRRISDGDLKKLGVIVFDLNGLKKVNDTMGHDKGDQYIKTACQMICRAFGHSPVFRIGGDEFVAILEGEDYENREMLLSFFQKQIEDNKRRGTVVVSSGLEEFHPESDNSFRTVFERADKKMYYCKRKLKEEA